ncbi:MULTISPECIES: LacI family DNA-binding transcriptional regulator [Vibrio]|uniref:LacI family DNA-binding transcriptional regulator n=1 Tax=Vibrio TaxID=662 RepID=UPI0001B9470F|nr:MULTISPECIES: LacI family DNA-binding transcriptional regulator [Vibrio]EEX37396.1 sucrose operon repressor ScrR LacI family [Vibrio metschnikovii CIP 69.14]EKO3571011.1 LacI family DNA-binding transcriptional regulator [Vibrio metschnikovii]EKO3579820.1 LacI family DNA-binding transcriptional regulator [Vibrio metschnikovii]EKO3619403.1 LacI family DNA-binding transcriptional regulator [Vibrio metschnikovii]EKO3624628.1 LacI family DNA-binding transcriptional regulator [Vibrio metschnikovi
MASLHDVARLAGVSKSTVSRVMNDEYGVKESTKIKVLKAVADCGYMVNQVAKDLKSQKTNLIGVIVPRVSSHATAQGVDGLTAIFEQAGKHVLLANTHQIHAKELEYIQIFNQKRVEGIIFYATHLDEPLIKAIQQSHVPVVLIGQDGSLYNIPSVVHDDLRVGFEAGNRLVAAGCEQIGFIGVQSDDLAVDALRSQGLAQSLALHQRELLFHARGDFSIESGYRLAKQQLQVFPQLDGLFCATDRLAVGAIKALHESGRIAGQQVKILGVGNDELAYVSTPSLSTFNYAFDKAGENAAKMLLDRIAGQGLEMSKVVLTFQNIDRETCSPLVS